MSDPERTVIKPHSGVAIGTRLNGIYEIEQLIAVGGMGEVYKGRAIQTGDAVAIKMIRPDLAQNEDALALFRKEAAALHNLYNEAIVRYYVFTIDPVTQAPYLAMEFVDGQPLSERVRQGPMALEEVDILRRRIATGLHAAHLLGITHRDVSPDNIILPGGQVARAKIIDFGIAKSSLMGEGTVIGSGFAGKYNYVSPEQLGLQGGEVSAKSDIYSLGLVLAEALGGKALDMGGSQMQILEKRRRVPNLSGIDARIRPLLARMLAPNPDDRPADMAEVAAWAPRSAAAAAPRRLPTGAITAATGVLLLALGGGFFAWTQWGQKPGDKSPAASQAPALSSPDIAAVKQPPAVPELTPAEPAPQPNAAPTLPAPTPAPSQQSAPRPPFEPQIASRTEPAPKPPAADPAAAPPPVAPRPLPQPTPLPDAQKAPPPSSTEQKLASATAEPPAAEPEPRTPVERIERYVGTYDGGTCFFLWPTEIAAGKADIEGFGSRAEPFIAFDTAFKQAQGFEAQINLRPVTNAQCPMVDFLRQLGRRIDRSPRLQIGAFTMKSGEVLSGSVESDGRQHLDVVLIGDDGLVYNLARYLKRDGAKASFTLKLESTGAATRPQTVLALASTAPFPALLGPNPAPASEFFANLSEDVARAGGKIGLGIKYFRIE